MSDTAFPPGLAVQLMCDLVSGIARSLADDPAQIRVESELTESETVIRLFVSESDLGKLIGKQGRTARSLRTIVSAAGNKLQGRFALDIRSTQ